MTRSRIAHRAIDRLWDVPAYLPPSLTLEWRFVMIRWLGILFVAAGLPLTRLSGDRLLAAYSVLIVAALYNLTIQWTVRRRPELVVNGYVTTIGDCLLNIALVSVGGGFGSPFYYILYTVTISAAMRYGYGPSLGMALTFVAADALEQFPTAHPDAPFIFRSGFLIITAILAGYLRGQARRAEAALQDRLHEANLLNEATAMLAASLEFEPVLRAVAAAAAHFFGASNTVLELFEGPDTDHTGSPTVVQYPSSKRTSVANQLRGLCRRAAGGKSRRDGDEALFTVDTLPSGQQAIVFLLTIPARQSALAALALAIPSGQATPALGAGISTSFIERLTLAIENATLYRALAGRSNDLQRAYADLATAHQELLRVDEMKTNFLANVSHELRTPLTSIRSFSELLLSYDEIAVQREFIEIINSESERLTRLVNDVLDIAKIESGNMDWNVTAFDLTALLRESIRTYARLIEDAQLIFQVDIGADPLLVEGDRDRLQQVVGNLLTNAMKFTPSGTIKLTAMRVGGDACIAVSDTGIGVAPEDQERIFEKFQQVGPMLTNKPHGTGLGLSICREIVEYHKGHIWLESTLGAGSTFAFSLALAAEPARACEPAVVGSAAGGA